MYRAGDELACFRVDEFMHGAKELGTVGGMRRHMFSGTCRKTLQVHDSIGKQDALSLSKLFILKILSGVSSTMPKLPPIYKRQTSSKQIRRTAPMPLTPFSSEAKCLR